jgi:ribosomal RNA-processing protein 12
VIFLIRMFEIVKNTMESLEVSLGKIRHHAASRIEHQKRPALLLAALESTLNEQTSPRTPTAYFAALLTTTSQLVSQQGDNDGTVAAALYLLALVAPHTPKPVLRSKSDALIQVAVPLLVSFGADAPALKSLLSVLQPVLGSLSVEQLAQPAVGQAYSTVLSIVADPRPKVRRKAQDVVQSILKGTSGTSSKHPYALRTAQWTVRELERTLDEGRKRKGGKKGEEAEAAQASRAMALCGFIRTIIGQWPEEVSKFFSSGLCIKIDL